MFSTNILKNNILSDDPLLNFKKGDLIYVKGEILIEDKISNTLNYMLFLNYFQVKITGYGLAGDGHIIIVPVDTSNLKFKKGYIIINYDLAKNKMTYPLIEIKTKI